MYHVNFCAGPAQLSEQVYSSLSQMIQNYQGTGLSLLSISHRDPLFAKVNENIKSHLRALLALSEEYEILLMPAGASAQFAAVPMNLKSKGHALYFNSGYWANTAINEAKKFIEVEVKTGIDLEIGTLNDEYDYIHYTENETIDGVQWSFVPAAHLPVVCDMSSSFLSKLIDVSKYDLIYAGAQKNIGLPGVTVVIIRKTMLNAMNAGNIPAILSYQTMQKAESLYNTPDVIAWVAMELVLKDLIRQGGLSVIQEKNTTKAELLYQAIDESRLFSNKVEAKNRSLMNVVFQLPSVELTTAFLDFADKRGVYGIAGHRSLGGMRVSLYNAIKQQEVEYLISVMREFAANSFVT